VVGGLPTEQSKPSRGSCAEQEVKLYCRFFKHPPGYLAHTSTFDRVTAAMAAPKGVLDAEVDRMVVKWLKKRK
jgi:hypothetical protein